jgi:hypothetical protein
MRVRLRRCFGQERLRHELRTVVAAQERRRATLANQTRESTLITFAPIGADCATGANPAIPQRPENPEADQRPYQAPY